MNHTISGNNFHGYYSIIIRAPKGGGYLSQRQLSKIADAKCGISDCRCGGGYGAGKDATSARIDQDGYLHPANCQCEYLCKVLR